MSRWFSLPVLDVFSFVPMWNRSENNAPIPSMVRASVYWGGKNTMMWRSLRRWKDKGLYLSFWPWTAGCRPHSDCLWFPHCADPGSGRAARPPRTRWCWPPRWRRTCAEDAFRWALLEHIYNTWTQRRTTRRPWAQRPTALWSLENETVCCVEYWNLYSGFWHLLTCTRWAPPWRSRWTPAPGWVRGVRSVWPPSRTGRGWRRGRSRGSRPMWGCWRYRPGRGWRWRGRTQEHKEFLESRWGISEDICLFVLTL